VKEREQKAMEVAGSSETKPVPAAEHAGSREEQEEGTEQRVDNTQVEKQQVVGSLDLQQYTIVISLLAHNCPLLQRSVLEWWKSKDTRKEKCFRAV
jgi:hypothetical protein